MSLDFNKALNSPQPMRLLLECKNSEIRMPHWLNNNNIALLQKKLERSTRPNKNIIYGINNEFQLWSYSLNEDVFSIVGQLPKTIDYLSDIDATQLLITAWVSSSKEVVELIDDVFLP